MEEDAEAVHGNHVPECKAGVTGRDVDTDERQQRSDQRECPQRFLTALFIQQRVEQHDYNAKNAEHNFRQEAEVILDVGNDLSARSGIHWPTALLTSWANGASEACTAGAIMLSQISGATPIRSATTAVGQSAAFSRRARSGKVLLTSCVTFPKKTL